MDTDVDFVRLSATIASALQQPVALDKEVLDFIASSLGTATNEQLRRLFTTAHGSEFAAVLDLIFFPSISLQVELEPCLSGSGLTKKQVGRLSKQLTQRKLTGLVMLPACDAPVPVSLSAEIIEAFIRRLNLDWRPDPGVWAALETYCQAKEGGRFKVLLRNQRCRFHAGSAAFSAELIKLMHGHADFGEIFQMLACSFDQWPQGLSAREFLAVQRKICTDALAKAARINSLRRRVGFEYALSSGLRMPYIDEDEARRRIVMIDEVCLAVFGRLPAVL